MRRTLPLLLAAASLAACQSGGGQQGKLRADIAAAETRIAGIEADIDRNAGPLATRTEAVRAEIRYRPISAWAQSIAAKPVAQRTLAFQQTGSGGKLIEQLQVCKLLGAKPGYWAAIPASNPVSSSIVIGSLTLTADPSGYLVNIPLQLSAAAAVEGRFQLPCLPFGPTLTAGFSGSASPATSFRLNFTGVTEGALGYSLDLVAPAQLSVAAQVDLGKFHFDFALPMNNLTRQLTTGTIDLPFDTKGVIALPGGKPVPYTIAITDPQLQPGTDAIIVSANLAITIGDGRPLSVQLAEPN